MAKGEGDAEKVLGKDKWFSESQRQEYQHEFRTDLGFVAIRVCERRGKRRYR
jgi:hypothetical protein